MTFPMKNSVLDNYPSCLPAQAPPEKRKFYFYCRLAFSDFFLPDFSGSVMALAHQTDTGHFLKDRPLKDTVASF